jgi:hypothetical protein
VVERRSSGFELRLSIEEGKGGERQIVAARCDELGGVAAVALVLLLTSSARGEGESDSHGEKGPSEQSSSPSTASEASRLNAEATNDEAVDAEPRRPERFRWLLDAPLFGLGLGPLPKPYPVLALGVGVQRGSVSLRLIGQWGLAQEIPASAAGYGVEARRAAIGAWGCADISQSPISVAPCLQASVTHVFARGYGPSLRSASQNDTSAALGAGVLLRWRLRDRLALMFGAGAQVELSRPLLVLEPWGTVQQLAPFSGTLILGPEWIF